MKSNSKFIALLLGFLVFFSVSSVCVSSFAAGTEEIIAGTVVKTDKGLVVEADDGDYLVKGQDLSKMLGKMVEVTGIITETDKGETIEVKSFEEIQE
jgi:hypothetical protein